MNDDEILNIIKEALAAVATDRSEYFQQITLESDMKSLGIDSILTLEMVGIIEDRLAETFDEQELSSVQKIGDLAAVIRKRMGPH